jgi:VanZ family protein
VRSFLKNQFPLLVWLALIYWLSSIPRIPEIRLIPMPDKVAHFTIFFVLCWFGHRAFLMQERFPRLRRHALLVAFLLSALYGFSDEVHQRYVPGRTYDYKDMAADATGAALYAGLQLLNARRKSAVGRGSAHAG